MKGYFFYAVLLGGLLTGFLPLSIGAQEIAPREEPARNASPAQTNRPALNPEADISIGLEDIRIEQSLEGGYFLWIRKKKDINSVLLTESTEDPARRLASFAYRSKTYNSYNGDEIRILNSQILNPGPGRYFLVDSTPEPDEQFGLAFRLFIPYVLEYGYPWSRQGEVLVTDGTYLNIRSFAKPYADYTGTFKDNPFVFRIIQRVIPLPRPEKILSDIKEEFSKITEETKGETYESTGEEDMIEKIARIIDQQKGKTLDLILTLDTTQSMEDDIPYLRKLLVPMVAERIKGFDRIRIGLTLYRDYMEEYLTRSYPFTTDLNQLQRMIDAIRVAGGRDIPEAVHEGIYAAIHNYTWEAASRVIIVIGDAPPHPIPRGKITEEMVKKDAEDRNILVYTIILPH
ncbi:MAG: vWA domain-containing protein [Spirochaetales bacterium]